MLSYKKMFFIIYFTSIIVAAAPYIPENELQVLVTIPGQNSAIHQLRQKLKHNPNNYSLLNQIILSYFQLSKQTGDQRYYSYAESLINHHLDNKTTIPTRHYVDLKRHQATILQHRHEFKAALSILNSIIQQHPQQYSFYFLRSTIYQVIGEYTLAKKDCQRLIGRYNMLLTTACLSQMVGLTGQIDAAFSLLHKTYLKDQHANTDAKLYVLSILAEMAQRKGDNEAAKQFYQDGLAITPGDQYLLTSYSAFLLDNHQNEQVSKLLGTTPFTDILLLNKLIAAVRLNHQSDIQRLNQLFQNKIKETKLRGDTPHINVLARYELEYNHNYSKASNLALQNWRQNKEPDDLKLMLQAAIQANDITTFNEAVTWIEKNHMEDSRFKKMIQQFKKNRDG